MTFVDTNVLVYAVGRAHPLKEPARRFFEEALASGMRLCTSAEVLQELLHVYLPVGRLKTLDAALALVDASIRDVWPLEAEDVRLARTLASDHSLGARDLIHLAACRRRGIRKLETFDRALAAAFGSGRA